MTAIWITVGILALACLVATWLDRRAESQRISRERRRFYKGTL